MILSQLLLPTLIGLSFAGNQPVAAIPLTIFPSTVRPIDGAYYPIDDVTPSPMLIPSVVEVRSRTVANPRGLYEVIILNAATSTQTPTPTDSRWKIRTFDADGVMRINTTLKANTPVTVVLRNQGVLSASDWDLAAAKPGKAPSREMNGQTMVTTTSPVGTTTISASISVPPPPPPRQATLQRVGPMSTVRPIDATATAPDTGGSQSVTIKFNANLEGDGYKYIIWNGAGTSTPSLGSSSWKPLGQGKQDFTVPHSNPGGGPIRVFVKLPSNTVESLNVQSISDDFVINFAYGSDPKSTVRPIDLVGAMAAQPDADGNQVITMKFKYPHENQSFDYIVWTGMGTVPPGISSGEWTPYTYPSRTDNSQLGILSDEAPITIWNKGNDRVRVFIRFKCRTQEVVAKKK